MAFRLAHPLPRRGIVPLLSQQMVNYICRKRLDPGAPFYSDHELVESTGLSRPTIRKCLEVLRREGWIERQNGRGTFIGPRALYPLDNKLARPSERASFRVMAAVFSRIDEPDTVGSGILRGIDSVADELGLSLEMLVVGVQARRSLSSRLAMSKPDVIVTVGADPEHTYLIAEAQRLGIPVIIGGIRLRDWGLPIVSADHVGDKCMAVRRLAALGHRRIGLVTWTISPRGFLDRKGYFQGLEEAGLPLDENGISWIADPEVDPEGLLEAYLKRWRPTAVIFATGGLVRFLTPLIRSGQMRVPRDLSVVVTETHTPVRDWLGGVTPTTACPANESIGREIAKLARDIARGETHELVNIVPGVWTGGESVTAQKAE